MDQTPEALRRIAEESVARTGRLDLSGLVMPGLPAALFDLHHLQELGLGGLEGDSFEHIEPYVQPVEADLADLARLSLLRTLALDFSDFSDARRVGNLVGLERLSIRATRTADLAPLANLSALTTLHCSGTQVADLAPLANLSALTTLDCSGTQVADLAPLANLSALTTLDCFGTQVADLAPLANLSALTTLDCFGTQVADLAPLANLSALTTLHCAHTKFADLAPLANLSALTTLDCSATQVADLAPLANLPALTTLHCSGTQVADLAPLANLSALTTLYCSGTQVADLAPLANLSALTTLDCAYTQVADLAPLANLSALTTLDCSGTQVADLAPLANLSALTTLDCAYTHVADLAPLANLSAFTTLDCSATQVADLATVQGLAMLKGLSCSDCHCLAALPTVLLQMPHLHYLNLHGVTLRNIPTELLSENYNDNCLERLRAYFRDQTRGESRAADTRLLLLGNGRVGKTQIARWLAGQDFDATIPSTHGIQIGAIDLPGQIRIQIWDFGGQEIYHGTHALFLRAPAVIMPIWAPAVEPDQAPTHAIDGLTFHNNTLAWWAHLVRHLRHAASPVVFVQARCDTPALEVHHLPVPVGTLATLPFKRHIHVSAKQRLGQDELIAALRAAIAWMRGPARLGEPVIGPVWHRVQRRLEARRKAGRPEDRWIERSAFNAICAEEGGVASTEVLLYWLDATGIVLHRPGVFAGRVILDQNWALGAIYAVFDRDRCYRQIVSQGGRFSRWLLGLSKWHAHGDTEQLLLLSVMRRCGICFLHRRAGPDDDPNDEYIAPDLLPARSAIEMELENRWDADIATETIAVRYDLIHDGLIRGIMSAIGDKAGLDALYWKHGVLAWDAGFGSRLRIEQTQHDDGRGEICLRAQRGRARAALAALVQLVEEVQAELGLTPITVPVPAATAPERVVATPLNPGREPSPMAEWYVSYAWNDDKSPAGAIREQKVDAMIAAARTRGLKVYRDKDDLNPGDSIERFVRRIGSGHRVFIFLSAKYLKSVWCLFELSEVWRNCRQNPEELRARVRLWTLDDADIWSIAARAAHGRYWREQHAALAPDVADLGDRDMLAWRRMRTFHHEVGDILATFAETVQARKFEDFLTYGFEDPPASS